MKPKFSKPFNIEHARAGAPYCCRDGEEATVLKWDRRTMAYQLVGIAGNKDSVRSWQPDGREAIGCVTNYDLVMLPLGEIDGKPVFVGDEIVSETYQPEIVEAGKSYKWRKYSWPAPAKIYPETRMTGNELLVEWQVTDDLRDAANAALRHAIDSGQVVTAEQHARAVEALDRAGYRDCGVAGWQPLRDQARDDLAFFGIVNVGTVYGSPEVVAHIEEVMSRNVARDMSIARAVRDACRSKFRSGRVAILESTAYGRISSIDPAAIIAGVES